MGKTIKRVSDEPYSGWDGLEPLNLEPGEEAEVSDEKAAQLAADFPHDFEIDGKQAKAAGRRKQSDPVPPAEVAPEEPAAASDATPDEQPKPKRAASKRARRTRRKS